MAISVFRLIVVILLGERLFVEAKLCWSGYSSYGDVCYKIVESKLSWDKARTYCKYNNGDLISIHNDPLFRHLKGQVDAHGFMWIGLRDVSNTWAFTWVDGNAHVEISWWKPGEPNHGKDKYLEDCGHYYTSNSATGLNDANCNVENPFICSGSGCPDIAHCERGYQNCTYNDNVCSKCVHNKVFYKPWDNERRCEKMCSHDSDYCWPGTCADDLVKGCSCATNFQKIATPSETSCQPETLPSIETCHTVMVGKNGEKKRAKSRTTSTECQDLGDFYGNFQPVTTTIDVFTAFRVDIASLSRSRPSFIVEENFGVTDVSVQLITRSKAGGELFSTTNHMLRDTTRSTKANDTFSKSTNITAQILNGSLNDGQRLCVMYHTKGGGYLKSKNNNGHVSEAVPYQKTSTSLELCYIYDDAPPEHCHQSGTCATEPLHVVERVTRSHLIPVQFRSWHDPIPQGGLRSGASGIESFQVTVHEVETSSVPLKVDSTPITSKMFNSLVSSMTLNLTIDRPKLLCIKLEVKDVADNVKQARRFVLIDNSSFIDTDTSKQFIVDSASASTQYRWQTHHHPVCLTWKDYFYNKVYMDNPFLERIEPAPPGLVTGEYDQITGQLPVSGTVNVYGIVAYEITWDLIGGKQSGSKLVPNITSQRSCLHIDLKDGDTYNLTVKASDIAKNSFAESKTLYIDRSVPHINNIWLVKDGYKTLFVHDSKDLSEMQLYFETLDPHSGMLTIEWSLGTSDARSELTTGTTKVNTINETACPYDENNCYCPDVGKCEIYRYVLPMSKLVAINKHEGTHNRNYFFTLIVTNNARLSNIEHLDILVDDSPPEIGVVHEGPVGGGEIDYISGDSLTVHWNGFIDHESGIKIYRVALARTCLDKTAFVNATVSEDTYDVKEVPYTLKSLSLSTNFTGKMFTTVVALNNAMDISEPVCSDGVTRDINPPILHNVTVLNAQWSESLACNDDEVWLLESMLTKVKLNNTTRCHKRCSGVKADSTIPAILPTSTLTVDEDKSNFLCETTQLLSTNNLIYLPHDNIYLSWDVKEDHSQLGDYQVGIGLSPSDSSSPTFLSYQSTNKHQYYSRHHIGVSSVQKFYIFVKATNKAGLESITTIGPVLVDETPPLYKTKPVVKIKADEVVVGWENDTFYDMEQTEPINKIHFQFGHNGDSVSPMLEWVKNISKDCPEFTGGCIKYPVARLQRQDTDLGLHFVVSLYVYNKASHFTMVETEPFLVPSTYPPGHATVFDIDPANPSSMSPDIDIHMTNNTLCASWTGFKHHENLTLEFAVGTSTGTVDVVAFQPVSNKEYHCQTSPSILPKVKYFVSIRARCSGGTTVSASDGVQIITEDSIASIFYARVGSECLQSNPMRTMTVRNKGNFYNLSLGTSFSLGYKYAIVLPSTHSMLTVSEQDGQLIKHFDSNLGTYYTILPLVDHPRITMACNVSCNISDVVYIYKCESSAYFVPGNNIQINWGCDTFEFPDIYYRLSVYKEIVNGTQLVSSFLTKGSRKQDKSLQEFFTSSTFQPGKPYSIAVQPCINNTCLDAVKTDTFKVESFPPRGQLEVAEITNDGNVCVDIHMTWSNFTCDSPVVLYQWAIVADVDTMQTMTKWRPAHQNNGVFDIEKCIPLSVHSRKAMYACVRAFSETGTMRQTCKRLDVKSLGEYASSTIYDFDTSKSNWKLIQKILPSKPVGQTTVLLHDAELDFGISSSKIVGAIAYGNGRNIIWYLMRRRTVPMVCEKEPDCKYQKESNSGFVEVPTDMIEMDVPNYICAFSPATTIEREYFIETLDEIKGCSNGFVLDDTPPLPGKVIVSNYGGYITDLTAVFIEWSGYTDNIDATKLGYVHTMKYYSYAFGSRPGGEDVVNFTNVGIETSVLVNNINAKDGSTIYVTVKASDYAGLTTSAVSEELIIDTTPPTHGRVLIHCGLLGKRVCNSNSIPIQLFAFKDAESGIISYEIDVGSSCGLGDIARTKSSRERFELDLHGIIEGHVYCVKAKTRNRANLSSEEASAQFVVDTSPPTGGHVLDGPVREQKDVDYQADVTYIAVHWRGFEDVQSGLDYYRVGLGLSPYVDDIEAMSFLGLRTEARWNTTFVPGQRYYTTVEACNQAGLCRSAVSDGVVLDNSPPIPGVVRVGSADRHSKFISSGSSVHIRWYGFEDPQSDIGRFEACIGTVAGKCDIVPFFSCLLQSNVIRTGLNLSSNETYYATVRCFNKIGLSVTESSDSFRLDSTPPEVITAPTFITNYTSTTRASVQWDRSILKLKWLYRDPESPIVNSIISLKTHHDGHTPIETLNVGPVNEVTLQMDNDKWLSDGDRYIAVVTSCNAAGHCSSAESSDILIDSTPPHLGGFKPPMTWHNFNSSKAEILAKVNLTWYGFHDEESSLETYYVSLSRTYSGEELSNGIVTILSNETIAMGLAEHTVSITLTESLRPDDTLILSIWARNRAGLNSSVARVSVNVLSTDSAKLDILSLSGILEIEKHSCDVHFCNKDCTCAVVGQPCTDVNTNSTCTHLDSTNTSTDTFPEILVFTGLKNAYVEFTASSACISANWDRKTTGSNVTIERYEWSMGLMSQPVGEGIFDLAKQRPWNDVGQQMEVVYCLKDNKSLVHDELYVVYVRVWLSKDTSLTYTSDHIRIDQTPPSVKRGGAIKDSDSSCKIEFDFIQWMQNITACWKGVFRETQSQITHYTLALGTSPMADDVYITTNVALAQSMTLNGLNLRHGTKYFITVTAYNSVDLHRSLSSDGFVVDMDDPVSGVVFNTASHIDTLYQDSTTEFFISWHGFQDNYSGIKSYSVALCGDNDTDKATFMNVGINNHHTFSGVALDHGKSYIGLVQATDLAGHTSAIMKSRPKTVDTTTPVGLSCAQFRVIDTQTILISRQQNALGEYNFTRGSLVSVQGCMSSNEHRLFLRISNEISALPISSSHNGTFTFEHAFIPGKDGNTILSLDIDHPENETTKVEISICDVIKETRHSNFRIRQTEPATFVVQTMAWDSESSIYKMQLGVGSTPGGFQARSLSPIDPTHAITIHVEEPHGTPLYFTAIAENHAGLRSVFTSHPIVIDKTPAEFVQRPTLMINEGNASDNIDVRVVWKAEDPESSLQVCYCALGYPHKSATIKPFTEANDLDTCTFYNVSVVHGGVLVATVRCVNHVQLVSEETSNEQVISLEEPNIDSAKLEFIKTDERSPYTLKHPSPNKNANPTDFQSNNTCLQFEWSGFTDLSGYMNYEYRLFQTSDAGIWTGTGSETMARVNSLSLNRGEVYTAEVRASNNGGFVSKAITSNITISSEPILTGKGLQIKMEDSTLKLNWTEVFLQSPRTPCLYDVMVGTSAGYNDVLDRSAIVQTQYDVTIGSSMLLLGANESHIMVTCVYVTGESKSYMTTYTLV